jgi:hypothetical protein
MTAIQNSDRTWSVIDENGTALVHGFRTNEQAWNWIDRQQCDPLWRKSRNRWRGDPRPPRPLGMPRPPSRTAKALSRD